MASAGPSTEQVHPQGLAQSPSERSLNEQVCFDSDEQLYLPGRGSGSHSEKADWKFSRSSRTRWRMPVPFFPSQGGLHLRAITSLLGEAMCHGSTCLRAFLQGFLKCRVLAALHPRHFSGLGLRQATWEDEVT